MVRLEDVTLPDLGHLEKVSFVNACRKFFGTLPGQQLKDFAGELRSLTPQDREELIKLFRNVGFDATAST
jgi:hypothetical protein